MEYLIVIACDLSQGLYIRLFLLKDGEYNPVSWPKRLTVEAYYGTEKLARSFAEYAKAVIEDEQATAKVLFVE